jgi:hypothetical protein
MKATFEPLIDGAENSGEKLPVPFGSGVFESATMATGPAPPRW